jgi:hypothetical protein
MMFGSLAGNQHSPLPPFLSAMQPGEVFPSQSQGQTFGLLGQGQPRGHSSRFTEALDITHRPASDIRAGHTGRPPSTVEPLAPMASVVELSLASTYRAVARLSDVLRDYTSDQLQDVAAYLAARPHLIELLATAPAAIRNAYGDCVLRLEILFEPEEQWSKLYLVIQTKLSPDEIIVRSDRFRDEWILPRIDRFGAEFSITEEPA